MRDEVLSALRDPAQIADTQLIAVAERRCEDETRGIAKRLGAGRELIGLPPIESSLTQLLGTRQIEAQQLAAVIRHRFNLTLVRSSDQVAAVKDRGDESGADRGGPSNRLGGG